MIPYRAPREDFPIFLVRLGTALLVFAAAASLVASADRRAGILWAVLIAAGTVLVWLALGRRPIARTRRTEEKDHAPRAARAVLVASYACLVSFLLLTEWPVYKLPAFSRLYGFIPSLLPYSPDWLGSGISPNQTGGVLACCLAFAAALFIPVGGEGPRDPRLRQLRKAAAPLLVVGALVVVATGSRAALAGLVVAVLAGILTLNSRAMWLVAGATAAAGAVAVALPDIPRELMQIFLHDEPLGIKLLARADIWASALKGIADHPFAGIGPGALNHVLPVRYPYGMVGLGYTVTQAHNIVLDTALTMGVVGAVGVVSALTGGIWWGIRCARTAPLRGVRATLARAFTAPLVTFTVFGITDALSFSSPSSLVFWVFLAGLMFVTHGGRAPTDDLAAGTNGIGRRDNGCTVDRGPLKPSAASRESR